MAAALPCLDWTAAAAEPPSSASLETKQAWMRARQKAARLAVAKRERAMAMHRLPRHPLADQSCAYCVNVDGVATGYRPGRGRQGALCGCVSRRAFRLVMRKRAQLANLPGGSVLERMPVRGGGFGYTYSMPAAEFLADVTLSARRELGDARWPLFEMHYLRGLEWFKCLPKLARLGVLAGTNRGNFFHECYRVEEQMGWHWLEIGMAPTRRYFRSVPSWSAAVDPGSRHYVGSTIAKQLAIDRGALPVFGNEFIRWQRRRRRLSDETNDA